MTDTLHCGKARGENRCVADRRSPLMIQMAKSFLCPGIAVPALVGCSVLGCGGPTTPGPAQIAVPGAMVSIRPGAAFPATSDNRTTVHIGELKEREGVKLYETVVDEMLCIGGTVGCGLDGLHALPSPVTLKTNVDYVIVLRGTTRRFTGHVKTGDEFFVFGQRVIRSAFVRSVQEFVSDGTYPAGVFRIVNGRGTIY